MTTDIKERQPPIVVAAFEEDEQVSSTVRLLTECGIGLDFIGVFIGHAAFGVNGSGPLKLLSVLAPTRRHEEIKAAFALTGAKVVGDVPTMRSLYGVVPHPGAFEHSDMKLPMGCEYGDGHRNGADARLKERR